MTISLTSSKLVRNTILTGGCPKVFEDFGVGGKSGNFRKNLVEFRVEKVHLCL